MNALTSALIAAVAVILTVIGAAWRLGRLFAKTEEVAPKAVREAVEALYSRLKEHDLRNLEARLERVEERVARTRKEDDERLDARLDRIETHLATLQRPRE